MAAQSAVHEIEAYIALLLSCTSMGFARLIEIQQQNGKQLELVVKGLAASVQAMQSASAPSAQPKSLTVPLPGKELYMVSDGERGVGPYSVDKLRALLEKGTITNDTYVLKQGTQDWVTLDSVLRSQA